VILALERLVGMRNQKGEPRLHVHVQHPYKRRSLTLTAESQFEFICSAPKSFSRRTDRVNARVADCGSRDINFLVLCCLLGTAARARAAIVGLNDGLSEPFEPLFVLVVLGFRRAVFKDRLPNCDLCSSD